MIGWKDCTNCCGKPYTYGAPAIKQSFFPEYYVSRPQHKHKTEAESVVKLLIDAGADLNIKEKVVCMCSCMDVLAVQV